MIAAVPRNRRTVEGFRVTIILLLLTVSACGGTNSPHPERTSAENAQWAIVQEYLDLQAAGEEQAGGMHDIFMAGDGTVEENLQSAEEEHGQLPDATAAVAAARQLVAGGGPYTVEAAEFLIERSAGPFAMIDRLRHERLGELVAEVGPAEAFAALHAAEDVMWEALIARIGPDWSVVQDYLDEQDAWFERLRAAAAEDGGRPSMRKRPSVVRAVATARAILNAEGVHEKTVEAAEFLVDHAWDVPRGDWHGAVGARALATHAPPDYERWPRVLGALDMAPRPSGTGLPVSPIDEFFAEMASNADNPVLRAAAQYHLAAGLMREAKRSVMSSSEQEHAARRERALNQAKGLSAGVEDETFDDSTRGWGDEMPRTFAQAEADLIASIEHATVGSTLPEWTGRRLDGTQEPLSVYRGRVLLIDLWATWCMLVLIASLCPLVTCSVVVLPRRFSDRADCAITFVTAERRRAAVRRASVRLAARGGDAVGGVAVARLTTAARTGAVKVKTGRLGGCSNSSPATSLSRSSRVGEPISRVSWTSHGWSSSTRRTRAERNASEGVAAQARPAASTGTQWPS